MIKEGNTMYPHTIGSSNRTGSWDLTLGRSGEPRGEYAVHTMP